MPTKNQSPKKSNQPKLHSHRLQLTLQLLILGETFVRSLIVRITYIFFNFTHRDVGEGTCRIDLEKEVQNGNHLQNLNH